MSTEAGPAVMAAPAAVASEPWITGEKGWPETAIVGLEAMTIFDARGPRLTAGRVRTATTEGSSSAMAVRFTTTGEAASRPGAGRSVHVELYVPFTAVTQVDRLDLGSGTERTALPVAYCSAGAQPAATIEPGTAETQIDP